MDIKDKQIQSLEKEITRLKKVLTVFEKQMKQIQSRQIRTDERARHLKIDVEQIKNILKRAN